MVNRGFVGVVVLLAVVAIPSLDRASETPGQKCAVAKLKAAFKKAAAKSVCYEKALAKNLPVDSTCLTKAEATFATAFQKAEAKGGCATIGDAAGIEAMVDTCVGDLVGALPPTTSTSTTSTTSTSTTTSSCAPTMGQACSNACFSGVIQCDGTCNATPLPAQYGQSCGSVNCLCGYSIPKQIDCSGSCTPTDVCSCCGQFPC